MKNDLEIKWSHTALLLIVLGSLLWLLVDSRGGPAPGAEWHGDPSRGIGQTENRLCSTIVRDCSSEAEIRNEHCDRNKSYRELMGKFSYPLKDGQCQQELSRLDENCPDGCRLDFTNIMTIPGKVRFQFTRKPDESGRCRASGVMPLTITARCVPVD